MGLKLSSTEILISPSLVVSMGALVVELLHATSKKKPPKSINNLSIFENNKFEKIGKLVFLFKASVQPKSTIQ
jgi:hypothetical protein